MWFWVFILTLDFARLWESTLVPFMAALAGAGVGALVSFRFHRKELALHEEQMNEQRRQLAIQRDHAMREAAVDLIRSAYEVWARSAPLPGGINDTELAWALNDADAKTMFLAAQARDEDEPLISQEMYWVSQQLRVRSHNPSNGGKAMEEYYARLTEELRDRDIRSLATRLRALHEELPPPGFEKNSRNVSR